MAKPGFHGKDKQRCGARLKKGRNWHGGREYCRRWPVDGLFGKCHLHGGKSTGAKTPEGKVRSIAAMVEGRRCWLERMKAEGKKVPCGRSAKKWITKLKEEVEATKRLTRRYKRNGYDNPDKPDEEFVYTPDPTPTQRCLPKVNYRPDPQVAKTLAILRKWKSEGF